ncbi:MAG: winged helix DNA-binding domain-containing protein [Chloroflexota bacterium]|nr:winged helix DNA-binding domain-containing protein [Chloroflexota bacterium]
MTTCSQGFASGNRATSITLSLPEARRLAVASQGFGPKPPTPSVGHLRKLASRLHAFQIDSVNVLARAHYVPAFARLGPYPVDALDSLAYRKRELFEYWGHAACLLPIALYPLVRYRMHSEETREYMRSERGAYMAKVYAEVAERGPIAAAGLSNPGRRSGNWWGWGEGKATLEHLYNSGLVAIAGRRGFERLYDIAERVIPRAALDAPAPPREEAMKQLICLGAKACGVGTAGDITGYLYIDGWRDRMLPGPRWERPKGAGSQRTKSIGKRLVSELVEEGRLLPAQVEGWSEPAYIPPGVRVPRAVDARALVTPFDSLVWERSRMERLFGMKYTIEIYTPEPKRVYGYYVFPFLLGDTLVARCDLKAERGRKVLMVQSAHLEPGQDAREVVPELASELRQMQAWLELDGIEVADRGDLAAKLRRSVRHGRPRVGRTDRSGAAPNAIPDTCKRHNTNRGPRRKLML